MDTPYDFAERATLFGKRCRIFVKKVPRTFGVEEDGKQLIRSSGSVGANYFEAQEGLSKRDSIKSLRIARKEAKESMHWLAMFSVHIPDSLLDEERTSLCKEAKELVCILTTMLKKLEK